MPRIYINNFDDWGVGQYRCKLPTFNCYSELSKQSISLHLERELHSDEEFYQAYILHRNPMESSIFFMQTVQKKGAKFVLELDDDILAIPEWMPSEEYKASKWAFKKAVEIADEIWVSTEPLAEAVGQPHKTHVLPNLIDFNTFMKPVEDSTANPIRIVWTGSSWHEKDLEQLVNPVLQIIKEYGEKVQFLFWGCLPSEFADYIRVPGQNIAALVQKKHLSPNLLYLGGIPFKFYYDRLVKLGGYIGLAPLYDCQFNDSKSNIKYLEYSMAGMATIASNLPPYKCIENGVDGMLVEPYDEDGWYKAMKTLIDNASLRKTLLTNARTKVYERYSWQSQNKRQVWLEAFRRLVR